MLKQTTMATGQILSKQAYAGMTHGQRMAWHLDTMNGVYDSEYNISMSAEEASKHYMDITTPFLETHAVDAFKTIEHKMMQEIILCERSHEDIIFVQVDSCVACRYPISKLVEQLRETNPNCIPVLMKTQTGLVENEYKTHRAERYSNEGVDVGLLKTNIRYLVPMEEGDINVDMESEEDFINPEQSFGGFSKNTDGICVMEFPQGLEMNFLDDAMGRHLAEKGYWSRGDRNQLNDDVQVKLLIAMMKFIPGSKAVMFTRDNLMSEKVIKYRNQHPDMKLMLGWVGKA